MNDNLNVAVIQLTSTDNISENISQIRSLIQSITLNTDIVFLPENALFFRIKEGSAIPKFNMESPVLNDLQKLSDEANVSIHIGSLPLDRNGKTFSSSVLMIPSESPKIIYDKIHLFDVDMPNRPPIRESDVFSRGETPGIFQFKNWKFGSSICYDVRFSELYNFYATAGAECLLIPSAFLPETGAAHWHVLMRARAIESQSYVIAPAQGGVHTDKLGNSRRTYGHTIVVDPWGEILAEATTPEPQVLTVTLTKGKIDSIKTKIPMDKHRLSKFQ